MAKRISRESVCKKWALCNVLLIVATAVKSSDLLNNLLFASSHNTGRTIQMWPGFAPGHRQARLRKRPWHEHYENSKLA